MHVLSRTALVCALVAVGCGGEKKPPEAPTATSAVATPKEEAVAPKLDATSVPNTPTASGVKISDEIAKACGITTSEAYFAFDSAKITTAGPLDKLADCFTKGPMKGRVMKLVGHADPRGDADYNVQLGLSRADSVAKYLFGKGLDKKQATTTSRGAMDAKGTDEATWALDRRVDVVLADQT
jgi:peptidoglycan-associated lipoprotein